jgi:two-component system phosphate regulon response regulator PhoB
VEKKLMMGVQRILLAEVDPDVLETATFHLTRTGYAVERVSDGQEVIPAVRAALPDLVVLSNDLPGVSGLELCRRLRKDPTTRTVPIIMLSRRRGETDIVTGLELGADDYLAKPFSPRILVARVEAVLRRGNGRVRKRRAICVGGIEINPTRHQVRVEGNIVGLTPLEFRLLLLLARQPGEVFTRRQIIDAIHGPRQPATDRSVDVLVAGLRKKLAQMADRITTVRGQGYRFRPAGEEGSVASV